MSERQLLGYLPVDSANTGDTVMSVNPNKNKMNTNGMMRYVFNIFSPFSNDDWSSSKPSRIVSVCWTYYIINKRYL